MSIKPWKALETSYFRPRLRTDTCELSNGKLLDATIFEFRAWANVLALTKDHEAVLIRQYRHGVQDVLWEIPGGVVEDNENPLEGAKRELLEETGYVASEFVQVGTLYPNPALQTNTLYSFLALNAEKIAGQNLDAGEDIEVYLVPLADLVPMVKQGKIMHALNVAVLFQALVYLDRVK